jgi:hypothetical protein
MRRRASRGTTLLETTIVLATMTVVIGGSMALVQGVRDAWRVADQRATLQESGRHTLETVLGDLRRSGLTTVAGANYPAIWERPRGPDLTPRGALVATMNYADTSLVSEVYAANGNGDRVARNATRVSDEMVFQLPADLDGDGTPLDAKGDLEWSPELVSYRVVDDGRGDPWLWRVREQNGVVVEQHPVGPSVSSITFDVVFDDRSVRFGEVAVVLYLQDRDANGQLVTTAIEGSVALRNTKEL